MNAKKIHAKFGFGTYIFFQAIENALNYCEIATYSARLIKCNEGDLYVPFLIDDVLTDAQKVSALKNLEGLFLTDSYERDGVYYVSFRRPEKAKRKLKNIKVKTPRTQILTDMEARYDRFLEAHKQNKDAVLGNKWAQNRGALIHINATLKGLAREKLGKDASLSYIEEYVYKMFDAMLSAFDNWPPNKSKNKFTLISIGYNINDIIQHLINLKNGNNARKQDVGDRIEQAARKRGL